MDASTTGKAGDESVPSVSPAGVRDEDRSASTFHPEDSENLIEGEESLAEESFTGTEEDEEDSSWIQWFSNMKGNEFFCQVDEEYIQDDFNLTGLSAYVPYYDNALDVILDMESPNEDMLTEEQQEVVESAA